MEVVTSVTGTGNIVCIDSKLRTTYSCYLNTRQLYSCEVKNKFSSKKLQDIMNNDVDLTPSRRKPP